MGQFLSGTPWSCPKMGKRMVGDNCLGMAATGVEVFPEVKTSVISIRTYASLREHLSVLLALSLLPFA